MHALIKFGREDKNVELRDVGFDGWVSIEDGMNGMDEMRQSLAFLHRMRKKYFGPPT